MRDVMVRATGADGMVRAFSVSTRQTVEDARRAHCTSPVVTAALGRLLSAGAMMGGMSKGDLDILTLQLACDGPIKGMTVTADARGNVKGYPVTPCVILPASPKGKLDVGGAVGKGTLSVIKDLGLKEPYIGQIELVSGEIAEDLTYYFAKSEQIPSSVGLGVLMEKDNTVKQAGGFIVQLMPGAGEEIIEKLEENISRVTSVTDLLDRGIGAEGLLREVLSGMEPTITDTRPVRFYCNCSKERVTKALSAIGKEELQDMIDDGKPINVHCHFCNKNYEFSVEELKDISEGRAALTWGKSEGRRQSRASEERES